MRTVNTTLVVAAFQLVTLSSATAEGFTRSEIETAIKSLPPAEAKKVSAVLDRIAAKKSRPWLS